jgi:hypothetical protein
LEQYALEKNLPLSTDTVLAFIELEHQNRKVEPEYTKTGDKPDLLTAAQLDYDNFTFAVNIKTEIKEEATKQF